MKFSEYPVRVMSTKKIIEKTDVFTEQIKNAQSAKELFLILRKLDKFNDNLRSDISVINVKYTLNVNDQKILKLLMKLDAELPLTAESSKNCSLAILNSQFIEDIRAKFGNYWVNLLEIGIKLNDPCIVEEQIALNQISTQYGGIIGTAEIEFRGEKYNLSQIGKFMQDPDRATRKEAAFAHAKWYENHSKELGTIYDQMVKLRDKMAKKMGFRNFVDFAYLGLMRTDYNSHDVAKYRDQIREVCVPFASKLWAAQRKRIGVSHLYFYDNGYKFKDGNSVPNDNPEGILRKGRVMYNEMSPETGTFFQTMLDNDLIDVIARPGKTPGGYMTSFPRYQVPFIFANFNGTQGDVEVVTHEVGHAFQYYTARKIKPGDFISPTLEACEIHSMSMEFLTWPWMHNFFDNVSKFKKSHLEDALTFIPYGALVDHFQHYVYENPQVSHIDRMKKWRELEREYLPHMDYEDCEFLERGGYWMRQKHIFESPFYYIDYTLAQVVAFQFLIESHRDWNKAWKKYLRFCKMGGKYPFVTLLKKGGLRVPFDDDNIKKTFIPLKKILKDFA